MVNESKGIYCSHLEQLMPKSTKQSVKSFGTEKIDDYWLKEELSNRPVSIFEVEARLKSVGLDPYQVELILLRYIDNKTMPEIVKEQGWTSVSSANHHLRSSLKKLRERKFTFR